MSSAVDQEYWNSAYEKLPLRYDPSILQFTDLFDQYLEYGGTCFEIGCYPGQYLIYLCKRFGYLAHGIDATPNVLTLMPAFFRHNEVEFGGFFHGDFMHYESEGVYDVVCSFGFVEHFHNYEEVFERHIRMVKQSGILIVSCPNFRGIQYYLHKIFDPINLQRHVIAAMHPESWKRILIDHGMEILYLGYYRTADFWVDSPRKGFLFALLIGLTRRCMRQIDKAVKYPNPLLSPYIICIARKKA